MKLEKKISLHAFEVEYIDQREAKPRSLHRESIVLDGGRMNTLDHLNQTPQSWIRQQYAQQGYTVSAIHKGESLTAKVDTGFLWKLAALDAAAAKAGKSVAKLHPLPAAWPRSYRPLQPQQRPVRAWPSCWKGVQQYDRSPVARSPLPCPQPVSRRQRPPVDLSPCAARCSAAAPESRSHAEHVQGTVKPPPGWQRALQALSLPSQLRKFPAL